MRINWVKRKLNRNLPIRVAASRAIAHTIERLEPRQLLSSVVSTFPVPGADPSSWDGTASHIVAGPNGNYWFTDPTDNAIGEVTPAGKVTMFPLPDNGSGGNISDTPTDIIVGPDNNLWFTENGSDAIGQITPDGVITEFHTPTANSNPLGLTVGADGNIWFAESSGEAIGNITPSGTITEFPLNNLDVSYLDGIATGSDGNVWFIAYDNDGNGTIDSITPSGAISTYQLNADPTALAAGPDGNLWVGTDGGAIEQVTTGGTVTSFTLPDGSSVNSITAGTDGNLYYALSGSNQFGSITTAGVVSEFTLPAAGADAANANIEIADITQGSDGSLWFVDGYNPQVGTINLGNALLATSDNVTVTAGTATTSTVASFTDFTGASDPTDYTATLTLDDGSTLDGAITPNSAGGFDVSATNNWAIGYNNVTVTITDARDATRVATASSSVDATAPQATGAGVDVAATSGQLVSGTVAQFTGVALNSLSSYSATIDWGDGHTSDGTITLNDQGGFDVAGSNTYAASGSYTVTTTLSPYPDLVFVGGPLPVVSPVLPVSTSTPPLTGINPGGPMIPVGSTGTSTPPLTGINPGGPMIPANPTAGTSTPPLTGINPGGPMIPASSSGSGSGSAAPGVVVGPAVGVSGDGSATATSTATVALGAMNGTGYSVDATSTAPFSGIVADFTLANPSADITQYQATIHWSDPGVRDWFALSTPDSAGVISVDGNGGFTVATNANFTQSGLHHFIVTITDGTGAAVGVAYGQIIVDSPNTWLPIFVGGVASGGAVPYGAAVTGAATSPVLSENVKATDVTVKVVAGKTYKGDVGLLSGVVAGAPKLADLHGTIQWGDGTTSAATFAGGNKGFVAIRGKHAYSTAGSYTISVNLTQTLYTSGKADALYPLELPSVQSAANIKAVVHHGLVIVPGLAITATAGTAFDGTLASVTAPTLPIGDIRTVSIWWGDDTNSTGVLSTSGDLLTISGAHVYRKPGDYKIWIDVMQKPTIGKIGVLVRIESTATVTAATATA